MLITGDLSDITLRIGKQRGWNDQWTGLPQPHWTFMGSAWTVDFRETNNHTTTKPTGSALLLIPRMHFTYKWETMWKRNKQAFQGYICSLLQRVFLTTKKYLTTHKVPKLLCFVCINNKCFHSNNIYPEASSVVLQQTTALNVTKDSIPYPCTLYLFKTDTCLLSPENLPHQPTFHWSPWLHIFVVMLPKSDKTETKIVFF